MRSRILILLFGDIGDTLLTVPAMRALRNQFPRARIVVLGSPVATEIVKPLGLVDDALTIDKHVFDSPISVFRPGALRTLSSLLGELRKQHFDTTVIFHHLVSPWGSLKFAGLAFWSGAPERVGLDNGRGWFLTRRATDAGFGAYHESEYWLQVVATLGAHGDGRLEFPITDQDREQANALLKSNGIMGEKVLAIHPGTGAYGPGRRWPAERFAQSARMLLAREPMACIVVGTAEDSEAGNVVLAALQGQATNLLGHTSLGVLGAILQRCTLLLANDGGVAHVASAVGTPVVAVFGPSNDRAWRPLASVTVSAELPCRPCFYRDFSTGLRNGCSTRECLALVTPHAVAAAALDVLRETGG